MQIDTTSPAPLHRIDLRSRPAFAVTIVYLIAMTVLFYNVQDRPGMYGAIIAALAAVAVTAISTALLLWRFGRLSRRDALIIAGCALALAAAAGWSAANRYLVADRALALDGTTAQMTLRITSVQQTTYNTYCDAAVLDIGGENPPPYMKVYLTLSSDLAVEAGDTVRLTAALSRPDPDPVYDTATQLASRGIFLQATPVLADGSQVLPLYIYQSAGFNIDSLLGQMRGYITDTINRYVGGANTAITSVPGASFSGNPGDDEAGLLPALFLGDKSGMTRAVRQTAAQAGISYFFAVAGLHLSILIGFIYMILTRLTLRKRAACAIVMACTLIYMALAGFTPSVTRAGIMALFYYGAMLIGRQSDSLSSLNFAVVLMTLANPFAMGDVGLQLSYAATLGILLFTGPVGSLNTRVSRLRLPRIPRAALKYIVTGAVISAVACLFTLPVTSLRFGAFSTVAVISNLALTLPLQFSLICIPLLLPAAALHAPLLIINIPAQWLRWSAGLILRGIKLFAAIPFSYVSLNYLSVKLLIAAAVIAVVLCFVFRHRLLRRAAILAATGLAVAAAACTAAIPAMMAASGTAELYYYASGQSQQFAVAYRGDSMICDVSSGNTSLLPAMLDSLSMRGTVRAKRLLFTHYSSAMRRTLDALADYGAPEYVYLPSPASDSEAQLAAAVAADAAALGCQVLYFNGPVELGSAAPLTLNVVSMLTGPSAVPKVALDFSYAGHDAAYFSQGDLQAAQALLFPGSAARSVDVLLMGTYGSTANKNATFGVTPTVAAFVTQYRSGGSLREPYLPMDLQLYLAQNRRTAPCIDATGRVVQIAMPANGDVGWAVR